MYILPGYMMVGFSPHLCQKLQSLTTVRYELELEVCFLKWVVKKKQLHN